MCLTQPEIDQGLLYDKCMAVLPGPVVMNTEGFTEKGLKRKVAVQALFSKLLYLSEVCPIN